jgi:hypothetical protein
VVLENLARSPLAPWAAWSDGDGPWQPLAGDGPRYTFRPSSGRYSLAVVCDHESSRTTELTHALVAEIPHVFIACGRAVDRPSYRLHGKVSGAPAGAEVQVVVGNQVGGSPINNPIRDSYDALVYAGTVPIAATASSDGLTRAALLRRSVTITGDTTLDLDFATDPLPLVRQSVAISDALPGIIYAGTSFTNVEAGVYLALAGNDQEYTVVAPQALAAGDEQRFGASQSEGNDWTRSVSVRLDQARPLQLTLPPLLTGMTLEAVAAPTQELVRVGLDPVPGALYYLMSEGGVRSLVTSRWLGPATRYTPPDLSALPGWKASWSRQPGTQTYVRVTAVTSNRPPEQFWAAYVSGRHTDGAVTSASTRGLTIGGP